MRLADKTCIITAAGAGIGRACALAFCREGARVWATDIDAAALESLAMESPGIEAAPLDVTDSAAVDAFADRVGAVDVLFNCAGFVHHGTLLDCDEAAWDFSFDLNVKGMYRMCRAFLPGMIERGQGNIINMSSVAGVSTAAPNRCVYSATKAAVAGLTRAIASDFVGSGVRCNAICPGTVDTPSLQGRLAAFDDPAQARRDFEQRQPMGRLGSAGEIAHLAVYLASDESSYTTGHLHVIDGGWSNG